MTVANILQEAGAVVVYGIVGYKTHAKMKLILPNKVSMHVLLSK